MTKVGTSYLYVKGQLITAFKRDGVTALPIRGGGSKPWSSVDHRPAQFSFGTHCMLSSQVCWTVNTPIKTFLIYNNLLYLLLFCLIEHIIIFLSSLSTYNRLADRAANIPLPCQLKQNTSSPIYIGHSTFHFSSFSLKQTSIFSNVFLHFMCTAR